MKKLPLILITPSTAKRGIEFADCSVSLSNRYAQAIQAAGGLPWIVPLTLDADALNACVQMCDGVMLTGGDDVQHQLYAPRLATALRAKVHAPDPQRDWLEFRLIEEVFRRRKPLLAICRGQQVLNVAFGGTLIVDIATEVPQALNHQCSKRKDVLVHKVSLLPDSHLAKLAGTNWIGVNSSHHQAVKRVAAPFRATAISPDGVIEALELNSSDVHLLPYLLAVQFHPERLFERHREFLALFQHFTAACSSRSKRPI